MTAPQDPFKKILHGYSAFREKYVLGDQSIMRSLSQEGQQPQVMVVACCDSRVDPALILQCDPGDLFVVRNVANIVPPYEKDGKHHGTSAALEFGVCALNIAHLILLGHSQCGGIQALINHSESQDNDFINHWVSQIQIDHTHPKTVDDYARYALGQSYHHCMTFPWIQEKVAQKALMIHLWFFDIHSGQIFIYDQDKGAYGPLSA